MKIPVLNIYYLLCYAWDRLAERDVVDVDTVDSPGLADLLARVLVNGTHHLIRRGFDRGYATQREWTSRPRGRIDFQQVAKQGRTAAARLPCSFDEFSHDVLHNQILKTTMVRLLRIPGLNSRCGEDLCRLRRLFTEINDIELSGRVFRQVQLHRNNQFYDFLLKVCELIYWNTLASEHHGAARFMDFVRDDKQMAGLYEAFVRNFYAREATGYRVKRQNIAWMWQPVDDSSASLLPRMQTDISLTSDTRKIIIECKFTPEATQRHYEAEKLRSGHLYQIHAYLSNLEPGALTDTCRVVLLYPTTNEPFSATYSDGGRAIWIRTINLDQPWQQIHEDLLALVA